MAKFPADAHSYRITHHAISKCIERGFAKNELEAVAIIRAALRNPEVTYESTLHNGQWKAHAYQGRMCLVVDAGNRSVPTVFISGAEQERAKEKE